MVEALTARITPARPRHIVVVGETFPASRTPQRVLAMRQLGHTVHTIPTTLPGNDYETSPTMMARLRYRIRLPTDPAGANDAILSLRERVDILWLETANMIRVRTLKRLKTIYPRISIVWYSEDDMMNPRNRSIWLNKTMPKIDLWATTKSLNNRTEERAALGLGRVIFVNNSYDPKAHRPVDISASDREAFGSPISFIGTFEAPRARSVLYLARSGLQVRVWGNGWDRMRDHHENLVIEGRPAYGIEFAKVVAASPVNLCFLRHANRDLQTCRSIELPACGGFMIHERNEEITGLLRELREAVYFSNDAELLRQCHYWLKRKEAREAIAAGGRRRVGELRLTHEANISRILNRLDATGMGQAV